MQWQRKVCAPAQKKKKKTLVVQSIPNSLYVLHYPDSQEDCKNRICFTTFYLPSPLFHHPQIASTDTLATAML